MAPSQFPNRGVILYLDDDVGNLIAFESSFLRQFEVLTASTVADARQLLAQHTVQVLITDQRMPERTGIEFLKEVLPLYPEIVPIIVTAYADIEVVVRAINECNIYRYITKPWSLDDLRLTLENALETHRLRNENHRLVADLQLAKAQLEAKVADLQHLNAELTAYTLRLVEQSGGLQRLREDLASVSDELARAQAGIQRAVQTASQNARTQKYWDEFMLLFDRLQESYLPRLSQQFPDLTSNDLRLCAMVKLNLSNKEIADILGISPTSVNMARYRLRKKLQLASEQSLEGFLQAS